MVQPQEKYSNNLLWLEAGIKLSKFRPELHWWWKQGHSYYFQCYFSCANPTFHKKVLNEAFSIFKSDFYVYAKPQNIFKWGMKEIQLNHQNSSVKHSDVSWMRAGALLHLGPSSWPFISLLHVHFWCGIDWCFATSSMEDHAFILKGKC